MATTTTSRPAAKAGSSARTARTTSKPQGALQIRQSGGSIVMSGGFDMSWELTPAQCRTYGQAMLNAAAKAEGTKPAR